MPSCRRHTRRFQLQWLVVGKENSQFPRSLQAKILFGWTPRRRDNEEISLSLSFCLLPRRPQLQCDHTLSISCTEHRRRQERRFILQIRSEDYYASTERCQDLERRSRDGTRRSLSTGTTQRETHCPFLAQRPRCHSTSSSGHLRVSKWANCQFAIQFR